MLHPHTELRFVSTEVGYGIFATHDIPKGTITWIKDALDRTFTKEQIESFSEPDRSNAYKYTYRTPDGLYLFCWDLTRFMNHSSEPNSMITPYGFEIAVRDIKAGDELTNDYGTLNIEEPFKCSYITNKGRQIVRPDDLQFYSDTWDSLLLGAFKAAQNLHQPLNAWMMDSQRDTLRRIAEGSEKAISIKTMYYAG